jgi:hypothetical protein
MYILDLHTRLNTCNFFQPLYTALWYWCRLILNQIKEQACPRRRVKHSETSGCKIPFAIVPLYIQQPFVIVGLAYYRRSYPHTIGPGTPQGASIFTLPANTLYPYPSRVPIYILRFPSIRTRLEVKVYKPAAVNTLARPNNNARPCSQTRKTHVT